MVPRKWISLATALGITAAFCAASDRSNALPAAGPLGSYTPPPCTGTIFSDVTCTTPFDAWIEQFARDGMTAGCGGGNYCPTASVTRDQMAVFVERAIRGTADWPPHTQLVWAIKDADGSPDPLASGSALLAAVAAIPTTGNDAPSAANPWLTKVGPGIFDLGSGSLEVPPYTSLEGAGQDVTVIKARGFSDTTLSRGTVMLAGHSRVSRLTVENTGGDTYDTALCLLPGATSIALEDVALRASAASSATSSAFCLYASTGASFDLTDADLQAQGGWSSIGIWLSASSTTSSLHRARMNVYGATHQNFGLDSDGASCSITDSQILVSDGITQDGIFFAGPGSALSLRDTTIEVAGDVGIGVALHDAAANLAGVSVNTPGLGVTTGGSGTAVVTNSMISGQYWLVILPGFTVTVGASRLLGPTQNLGGTVSCFGNYTDTVFLANTCP